MLFYIHVCLLSEYEDTTRVCHASVRVIKHPPEMLVDKLLLLFRRQNQLHDLSST